LKEKAPARERVPSPSGGGNVFRSEKKFSFPLRGKVGMGILYCATPVLSFPLRGKVGMGVVFSVNSVSTAARP